MTLPPPPPLPHNWPARQGQAGEGERPDPTPETHNFGGTKAAVHRRWDQQFARAYPEVGRDRKLVMKAVHMPHARWMFYKHPWGRGKWGWGCDLCTAELTEEHLKSKKHNTSTRNRYLIPICDVDFAGPSFEEATRASERPLPDAPGGVPRVLFPVGWESHPETIAFAPDWDHVPLGWPGEDAPEDFQTPTRFTPSEDRMLPPSAAGHFGRPAPAFLPAASNLVAPTRPSTHEGGASSGDPWRRPPGASARAPDVTAAGDRGGARPAWVEWAPGGTRRGQTGERARTGAHEGESRARTVSLTVPAAGPALSISQTRSRRFQDYGERQWQDTTRRPIGTPALGPLPGAEPVSEDWGGGASRFVGALVHSASRENNAAFGPEWTSSARDLAQIQDSGVTALGVSFYAANNPEELDAFRAAIPGAANPSFDAALQAGIDEGQEIICATWWAGYTLRHGEAEIDQCAYWISSRHPGVDHFASVWAIWPPRTIGGQHLTTHACVFLWNAAQQGPFFCPEKGRVNSGHECYRLDRVPDDSQLALIRRSAYGLYNQYMSAADMV